MAKGIMAKGITLLHGDCLELMKDIPDGSVDLVLTDPPYNMGVVQQKNGKKIKQQWDRIPNYRIWFAAWLKEAYRVLKPNGVLYFFHNDIHQIADILVDVKEQAHFELVSFCIWDKGDGYRAQSWKNRRPESDTALRSWFPICEYCLHFFKSGATGRSATGLEMINSSAECYRELKDWYLQEMERLGLDKKTIADQYTAATHKKPYMLNHYFNDSQFEMPTRSVWEAVYMPLGFSKSYEELRKSYEELRPTHIVDAMHCNIWHIPPISSNGRFHICQKPVELLKRLINVSSKPGATVLDMFMGSGSTGVACVNTGRRFIGIEKDEKYFELAKSRIEQEERDLIEQNKQAAGIDADNRPDVMESEPAGGDLRV